METQTQKSDMGTQWGKKQVGQIERISLTYTHTTCVRESGGPLCSAVMIQRDRMSGGGGSSTERELIHV